MKNIRQKALSQFYQFVHRKELTKRALKKEILIPVEVSLEEFRKKYDLSDKELKKLNS